MHSRRAAPPTDAGESANRDVMVYRIAGPLFFGAVLDDRDGAGADRTVSQNGHPRPVLRAARRSSAAASLRSFVERAPRYGARVYAAGATPSVRHVLVREGLKRPLVRYAASVADARIAARHRTIKRGLMTSAAFDVAVVGAGAAGLAGALALARDGFRTALIGAPEAKLRRPHGCAPRRLGALPRGARGLAGARSGRRAPRRHADHRRHRQPVPAAAGRLRGRARSVSTPSAGTSRARRSWRTWARRPVPPKTLDCSVSGGRARAWRRSCRACLERWFNAERPYRGGG